MKVAIIAFSNLKFSPYILPYVKVLKGVNAEIELIYPNRSNIDEKFDDGKLISVNWNPSKSKVVNFLSFRNAVIKQLSAVKYDFVIVLTTFPAVLLGGFLGRKYKNRYLVDVRDFTYENNKIFYHLEKKALKNAALRVISADGFKNFLPKGEYLFCPNISATYAAGENHCALNPDTPITISYVGTIAYKEQCRKLIDLVISDNRFAFYFYGNEIGDDTMKQYVDSLDCDRIKYFGEYKPEEKPNILEQTDILFNVYGNDRPLLKYALSNKLYDSMYYKKPLLVSPDTDMKKETREFSFAIDLDEAKDLNAAYDWYKKIDVNEFEKYADAYLANIFEQNEFFEIELRKVLMD